jgi:uncharacterized membrane protein
MFVSKIMRVCSVTHIDLLCYLHSLIYIHLNIQTETRIQINMGSCVFPSILCVFNSKLKAIFF